MRYQTPTNIEFGGGISALTSIAFFGNLHGNSAATAAVLKDIEQADVDAVYCLGDLVGYGAYPNESIAMVIGRGVPAIIGNYDDGVGYDRDDCGCAYRDDAEQERGQRSLMWTRSVTTNEHKAFLRELPFDIRFTRDDRRFRLVHGSPRRMNEYLFEDRDLHSLERVAAADDADILVFGHTHKPWVRKIGKVLMINAGSVGKPKDGDPRACWVRIDININEDPVVSFRRVAYDIASMARAIRDVPELPSQFAADIESGGATTQHG